MAITSIKIKNLTGNQLALSVFFSLRRQIQQTIAVGASFEVSSLATLDELNRNPEIRALLDATPPQIEIVVVGGADDIDELFIDSGEIVNVKMDTAADATGGATTTTVGLQLQNAQGENLALQTVVEFGVFDDAVLATPAVAATLDTETEGTIVGGAGTAALKIRTAANGRFTCTLTDAVDETVWLGCSPSFGSPIVDCRDIDAVTFSA